MVVFVTAAYYLRGERELKLFIVALAMAVGFESYDAVRQRYMDGIHRVFGTLDDSNSLSMYLCMTAPVFVTVVNSRLPKLLKGLAATVLAMACVGVILTISRTGVLTLGIGLLGATLATMSYAVTPRKVLLSLLVSVAVAGVIAKAWHSLGSRFEEASIKGEIKDKRAQGRGYYVRIALAIANDKPFGVGPNNWSYWVSNKYGPRLGWKFAPYRGTDKEPKYQLDEDSRVDDPQAAPAHSLAALTVGEMGFGGLFLLLLLWFRWFQMGASLIWKRTSDPMRRIGVGLFFGTVGIFCQSITEWVFHQTPIFFTFHILRGVLASLYWFKRRSPVLSERAREIKRAGAWLPRSQPAENW